MEILSGNHAQLERFLGHLDRIKRSPMIWGTFAIGKSMVVHRYGAKKAKEVGREFMVWHKIDQDYRRKLFEDQSEREKVYILYDNRAASNDMTDDKGLPNMSHELYLTWIQNLAYKIFSLPGAMGILLNDELSLAPTMVQNAMYKMIHDRSVGDIAFNDDIFIIGAGNRVEDQAFVQETPMPLKTRMGHFQLNKATPQEQITYYINNNFDPRLIGFFRAHEDLIFWWDEDSDEVTASTPRTTEFLSEAIATLDHNIPIEREDIHFLACGFISTYVGNMFIKFLDITSHIDFDAIIEDPSKALELEEIDEQYGLLTLLVSRFSKGQDPEKTFETCIKIYDYIPEEMGILLFRMMRSSGSELFGKLARGSVKCGKIFQSIAPFLLEED